MGWKLRTGLKTTRALTIYIYVPAVWRWEQNVKLLGLKVHTAYPMLLCQITEEQKGYNFSKQIFAQVNIFLQVFFKKQELFLATQSINL